MIYTETPLVMLGYRLTPEERVKLEKKAKEWATTPSQLTRKIVSDWLTANK